MAFDKSLNNLIIKAFQNEFEKNLAPDLKIGKIAKTDWNTGIDIGDEVDLILPGSVTLGSYTGGSLGTAEKISNTTIKIRVTSGKSIFFEIDKKKSKQINAAMGNAAQLAGLIKEYTKDAREQYANAIDVAYGALYSKAGYKINGGNATTPKAYTQSTIFELFTAMAAKFKRGQTVSGVYRPAWMQGKMKAFVAPEVEEVIVADSRLQYTESGKKQQEEGYVGTISGWDIFTSCNVASHNSGYECLFGIEGKSLGGIIEKEMDIISNIPDDRLDTQYKGAAVYGVDVARHDMFGAALVSVSYS